MTDKMAKAGERREHLRPTANPASGVGPGMNRTSIPGSLRQVLLGVLALAVLATLTSTAVAAGSPTYTYTTPDGWTHTSGLEERVAPAAPAAPSTEGLSPPGPRPEHAQARTDSSAQGGDVHSWEGESSTDGWVWKGWYESPPTACDTAHNTTVREALYIDTAKVKVSLRNICNDAGDLYGVFPEYSYWTQAGYNLCQWSSTYHYYTTLYWESLDAHLEAYIISAEGEFGISGPGGTNTCNAGDVGRFDVASQMWVVAWPTESLVGIWISRDIDNW